ncbi:MAG: hypothetical protein ACFHX7_06970 [Pseudomonadota bacterium]
MERVFYFSGYRMTVFDWDGSTLVGTSEFTPDDTGFEEFELLLDQSVTMPARLLVDMIEEDFRRETIPHVNRFDRDALIGRLLDKHYRDEEYVHAKVIGRTNIGRKDDRVLLSALTNTGLLAPWLERLDQYKVRLAGIWSLPHLTEKLLKAVMKDEEHALIVSRQVRSALRNSYIHKGKLLLSRQAKFDKGMWDRESFEGVIHNLERGTAEIYNFLLNQRMMRANDVLHVFCIVQEDQVDHASMLSSNTETINYTFVSLEQLFKHFGVHVPEGAGADALFAYLCTRTNPLADHYATQEQKSTYYRYLMDRVINQVAELGSLVCLTIAVLLALKSMELNQRYEVVADATLIMVTEYNEEFGEITDRLETAQLVEQSVQLLDEMTAEAQETPEKYLAPLASVFAEPEFGAITLSQFQWKKYRADEIRQLIAGVEGASPGEQELAIEAYDENGEPIPERRQAVITLTGTVDTRGTSYRGTTERMNRLVERLSAVSNVERVLLVRTAVDVRATSRFTDQVGTPAESAAAGGDPGTFEIMVIFEGVGHA